MTREELRNSPKRLESLWKMYSGLGVATGVDEDGLENMRLSFYSGAHSMMAILSLLIGPDQDRNVNEILKSANDEIDAVFRDDIETRRRAQS